MKTFLDLLASADHDKRTHTPLFFRLSNQLEKQQLQALIADDKVSFFHNDIVSQLQELIKSLNPAIRILEADYASRINDHLNGILIDDYGVWVYYPWNRRLVHLLDESEFVEVRTNRNQYKITKAERDQLLTKKIGIIGLSVGQSIALTIAMERGCGELRLADFDVLELSNLNRIRTGLHNIGIPKVVAVAREIAEIDPFIKVDCYFDGLTETNLDDFFLANGKLDILVDECDGLDMKIISRFKARELQIPVIMDTSDRGMLDVERFDLEPDRAVLHGTVADVDPDNIKSLNNEEKIPLMLQMLGLENISLRGKVSMLEVQQTINTWPQLASSVVLGGAVGADVCRRILLNQFHESGRYYIDLEELVGDKSANTASPNQIPANPFKPLSTTEMLSVINQKNLSDNLAVIPDDEIVKEIVSAACLAPSTGNDQPWKWVYTAGNLNLFHEQSRSFSFGDFQKIASYISFGAAFENLYLQALNHGLEASYSFNSNHDQNSLVATITFEKTNELNSYPFYDLSAGIAKRHTNRNPSAKTTLSEAEIGYLTAVTQSIQGASIHFFSGKEELNTLGEIIGACDRIRLLNPVGHHDFVHREMRWTEKDAIETGDGIDVRTLGLSNSQLAALGLLKDEKVISTIKSLEAGFALDMIAKKNIESAAAMVMITLPTYNLQNYFDGGRAMERFWLAATQLGIAVYPMISPFYLFPRILHGAGEGLDTKSITELKQVKKKFSQLTGFADNQAEIFIAKLSKAAPPVIKSLRLPLEDVLIIK
jgi:molybdopterin/thiamine biosynthesis adenylyltransferase/nitroreductase